MVESMVSTRQTARALALRGLKVTAAAADRIRPPGRGIVFLAYHCVGAGTGLEIDLSPAAFDQQMATLANLGTVVSIDDGLVLLAQPPPDGPDPVVVTFDDGTADFAEHAAPILERHRIPATLYLATDFVERQVPYAYGGRPVSWPALRDACASGLVTVGSHTHTHAVMDALDGREADEELRRSIALIEDNLGRPAEHFAYPKGVAGPPEVEDVVRRQFRSAALAVVATNPYQTTDPYRLARSPIQVSDGQRWFEHKVAGGMAFEGTLRHLLNRRRYAGLTT
jgi:peptidoglycan/xylan/chitin deacetylase (PgdA/CDA1 family)